MNIGMLWWNDPRQNRTLVEKVIEAVLYYRRKYGRAPELCLVNPNALTEPNLSIEAPEQIRILVKPWKYIQPDCLWIGVEEMPIQLKESEPA